MIDPEFKKRWLAALRSGKYRQIHGTLWGYLENANDKMMCCLGVACDINDPDKWGEGGDKRCHEFEAEYEAVLKPGTYGLNSAQIEELASINDEEYDEYKGVIEYIERNL